MMSNDEMENNEQEDQIPLVHRSMTENNNGAGRATSFQAALSIAKAVMGAGSFALPWAFKQTGYIAGPILMLFLMCLSIVSLQVLVRCRYLAFEVASLRRKNKEEAVEREKEKESVDSFVDSSNELGQYKKDKGKEVFASSYVDVAREAFGEKGAWTAYVASVSASVGVCGSYLVFIASSLASLIQQTTTGKEEDIGGDRLHTVIVLALLPLAIALSSVQDASHSAVSSLLGDISVCLGMIVVIAYGAIYGGKNDDGEVHTPGEGCEAVGPLETIPLAFGSVSFLFFVHFLILPIESSMSKPRDFPRTVSATMMICYIVSAIFGVAGYWYFGPNTEQIIILNVQGSAFVSCCKILLCIDLLFTYPVAMRPSIEIVERSLSSMAVLSMATIDPRLRHWRLRVAACVTLGLIAAGAGLLIPAFALLSGLVGGVAQTFLGFVFPPIMYLQLHRQICSHGKKKNKASSEYILAAGTVTFGIVMILWTINSTWSELHRI